MALKNRKKNSSKFAAEFSEQETQKLSPITIRRRLHEFGFRGYKARKKPLLSRRNIERRLKFAKNHKNWTAEDWTKVLWSDKSYVQVSSW